MRQDVFEVFTNLLNKGGIFITSRCGQMPLLQGYFVQFSVMFIRYLHPISD